MGINVGFISQCHIFMRYNLDKFKTTTKWNFLCIIFNFVLLSRMFKSHNKNKKIIVIIKLTYNKAKYIILEYNFYLKNFETYR